MGSNLKKQTKTKQNKKINVHSLLHEESLCLQRVTWRQAGFVSTWRTQKTGCEHTGPAFSPGSKFDSPAGVQVVKETRGDRKPDHL